MLASAAGARTRECMLPGRRVLATREWEGASCASCLSYPCTKYRTIIRDFQKPTYYCFNFLLLQILQNDLRGIKCEFLIRRASEILSTQI